MTMIQVLRRFTLACSVICTFAIPSLASGDIILRFSSDGGLTNATSFDVAENSSATISVFLAETSPDTILTDEGLLGFALIGTTSGDQAGSISDTSISPSFETIFTDTFSTTGFTWNAATLQTVPSGSQILLGDFEFEAIAVGTTVVTFADEVPGSGTANATWLSGFGTELDEAIFGTGANATFELTLNTTAVPEPGSSTLLLIAVLGWMASQRKRTAEF